MTSFRTELMEPKKETTKTTSINVEYPPLNNIEAETTQTMMFSMA